MNYSDTTFQCELGGVGVLVTRAEHQAKRLAQLINQQGGRPLRFPAVVIAPPEQPERAKACLNDLDSYQIVLFVSPNAVEWALKLIDEHQLPDETRIGAVGRGTALALAKAGYPVDIVPEGQFDSEALLATPALKRAQGKRILIVRGQGGRALLGDTLVERGAEVDYAEVYQRQCPSASPEVLIRRWTEDVDLVTATSTEILENLYIMLGLEGREILLDTPLVVISTRMRERAREMGFKQIILSQGADDQMLLRTLCAWVNQDR